MSESEATFLSVGLLIGTTVGILLGVEFGRERRAQAALRPSLRTLRQDPLEQAYRLNERDIDHEHDHFYGRPHEA